MKKLLLKCALLLVLAGSILYAGGVAYRQTNTYKNLERTEWTDSFQAMPDSIDVAVFGASHGKTDFRYAPEGDSFFNFSLSSQPPQYDEKMMRQYGNRFHEGTLVILTVSYLSPFWTDSEKTFSKKQPRYYRVLSPENIIDVDLSQYWLQRFSPLLTEDLSSIAAAFVKEVPLIETYEEQPCVKTSAEEMAAETDRILRDHISVIQSAFPEANPAMMDAFREMLTMCRENDWTAVLVTPPYLSEYNDCFSEDFFPVFYEKIDQLREEFDTLYLDYSHDPAYAGRYDLFKNIDHLNQDGAARFDEQFFADLQALGLR